MLLSQHKDILWITRILEKEGELSFGGLQRITNRYKETAINYQKVKSICELLEIFEIVEIDRKPKATYTKLTEKGKAIAKAIESEGLLD